MSAHPDKENLNRWLCKRKFEKDKTRKDKELSLWSREGWQAGAAAARDRDRAGTVKPELPYPIIITSSTGPFTTPQKLQEVGGLSSLPAVQWTTRTSVFDSDGEEGSKGPDGGKPEKVQYCDVSWEQLVRIKEYSDGESVLVWFQGKQRFAWLARSVKQKSGNQIGDRKS